jgi:hypothetical protein
VCTFRYARLLDSALMMVLVAAIGCAEKDPARHHSQGASNQPTADGTLSAHGCVMRTNRQRRKHADIRGCVSWAVDVCGRLPGEACGSDDTMRAEWSSRRRRAHETHL